MRYRVLAAVVWFQLVGSLSAASVQLLCSADNEGHVGPCQSCAVDVGQGGLARRGTVAGDARKAGDVLLVDAGNFLFGTDSVDSRGAVIVAGYNAIGYDAANISYRDFRLGRDQTMVLLRDARFAALSANCRDDKTGQLLFKPYVVKQLGSRRVAIIALSEAPPGLAYLPELKRELAGLHFDPPAKALAAILPEAKQQADLVLVLYYGSAAELQKVRDAAGNSVAAIVAGGLAADEAPAADGGPPIVTAEMHGKTLGALDLGAGNSATPRQLNVLADVAPDAKVLAALAPFASTSDASAMPAHLPAPATAPSVESPTAVVPATAPTTEPVAQFALPAVVQPPDVAGSPLRIARGLEDSGLGAEQINGAIDRGRAFLWNYLRTHDLGGNLDQLGNQREHLLCALALVHCDAQSRFSDFDGALRKMLGKIQPSTEGIYAAGILNMLIEGYDQRDFHSLLEQDSRFLLESQGTHGRFNYVGCTDAKLLAPQTQSAATPATGPVLWQRRGPFKSDYDGDNSVTQFGVLGLHSACQWGIEFPRTTWEKVIEGFVAAQQKDGGWSYNESGSSYGSMTCSGVCSLAIAHYHLGDKDFKADPAIARGLSWLGENFTVGANPANGGWHYYYLYSLERTGRILRTEFIGANEWYPQGASYLIRAQKPDGSWIGDGIEQDPRLATSFALLFLTRATPSLGADAHPDQGTLRTFVVKPTRRIYIILDCSGSMIDRMAGKQKFQIARDAIAHLVADLPAGSQVALRVYGHRKNALEAGADDDTELKIPMGPVDTKAFADALGTLRARGKTPLALSLQLARQDLGAPDKDTEVLLLTDGGEDTFPHKDPIKAAADLVKTPNINLDIIGFDIRDRTDWKRQLLDMAKQGHGLYLPADHVEDLDRQVQEAALRIPDSFEILDAAGKTIDRGKFGQTKTLAPGAYTLRTQYGPGTFDQRFIIAAGQQTGITFDAARMEK